ncbi:hypothetical protein PBAL39_13290 [Pedobacter sp. BAL39]|uniref:hypothetical protein n=1 Tax=Pedobacter sp. BAL39 TaxID=391596 RepID=UPI0001559779|nr:hypothetical protein [Pedobacter sp. BAL39]EDM35446.1 hypothetical protein PBAL39_13290 [Pedobacter sp. BAL39]
MDRLIIETILADVNEIFLAKDHSIPGQRTNIVLGFKAKNTEQIIHAFEVLKSMTQGHEVSLVICNTVQTGMYDLEICTEVLDEPIRIMNKVITNETIGEIKDHLLKSSPMMLSTNVSEDENWLDVNKVELKTCETNTPL